MRNREGGTRGGGEGGEGGRREGRGGEGKERGVKLFVVLAEMRMLGLLKNTNMSSK